MSTLFRISHYGVKHPWYTKIILFEHFNLIVSMLEMFVQLLERSFCRSGSLTNRL
jgi:hypothetical protein